MKKNKLLTGLAATVAFAMIASSGLAEITGSAHDFAGDAWNVDTGAGGMCNACHAPHEASNHSASKPLWDHAETGETFTMYASDTIDGAIAGAPQGVSLMCLSCHDGVTALDASGTNSDTMTTVSPTNVVAANLSNDHPISITYDVADTGLKPIDATISSWLSSGQMECSSCHDVHNGGTGTKLLHIANTSSELCLTCHAK